MTRRADGVVHVLNELKYSGAETLLSSGSNWLIADLSPQYILSTGGNVGDYAPTLIECGYEVIHIPFRKTVSYGMEFAKFIRSNPSRIVHIHAERGFMLHAILALLAGKKVVRTVHNAFRFSGPLRILRACERYLLSRAGVRMVACSQHVRQTEAETFLNRSVVVQNWIDTRRFRKRSASERRDARADLGIPESSFVLVSVGNHGKAKNQEAIVEAVRMSQPDMPVLYLHCGEGERDLRAALDITEADPVRFLGPVREVEKILRAADLFASPSHFEGGPLALFEAAATGLTCITTRVGMATQLEGHDEIIFVGVTPAEIALALRKAHRQGLEKGPDHQGKLPDFVAAHFGPETGAGAYSTLYRELLRGH
ncbi:MAG: glycosyltransferase family 4 protein [Caulobacter sp.]|nr:glycosyltransferase family 4 protein [Caulobacter sp.]